MPARRCIVAIDVGINPHYWRAGFPRLDHVVYRIVPDQAAISTALETGEVDAPAPSGKSSRSSERICRLCRS